MERGQGKDRDSISRLGQKQKLNESDPNKHILVEKIPVNPLNGKKKKKPQTHGTKNILMQS